MNRKIDIAPTFYILICLLCYLHELNIVHTFKYFAIEYIYMASTSIFRDIYFGRNEINISININKLYSLDLPASTKTKLTQQTSWYFNLFKEVQLEFL